MEAPLLQIHFNNTANRNIPQYPVTYGVPLPQGRLSDAAAVTVQLSDGTLAPTQTRALERWPDGSVRWLLLDFDLPLQANQAGTLDVVTTTATEAASALQVHDEADRVRVVSPLLDVSISKKQWALFASYQVNGREMASEGSDIIVERPSGKRYRASRCGVPSVRVVEDGPQRVVVESSGRHTAADGDTLLDFRLRYTFRPNEPAVSVAYLFRNREDPETGVHLAGIQIVCPLALGRDTTRYVRQLHSGVAWAPRMIDLAENVELISSFSESEAAKTTYGNAADGKIVVRSLETYGEDIGALPYYLKPGSVRVELSGGMRASYPYVAVNGTDASAVAWFMEMSQNFPKGIRSENGTFTFDVWPTWAGPLHFRRGMSKEHEIIIACADKPRDPVRMEDLYLQHEVPGLGVWGANARPLELTLDPEYVRSTEVLELHRWLPYLEDRYPIVEMQMGTLGTPRHHPNFGMIDYGDTVARNGAWCHNNENDQILNSIREYYRRGEFSLLVSALAKAQHNAHIDFISHDPDDPLREHSMPAHCPNHTDGASYPSHMWVDGLMAAYCITGNPDFREVALAVGENLLRWQEMRPQVFYADSRECGWPMLAFLRLHDHNREQRWLEGCQEVFEFYRDKIDEEGRILYDLPHGIGAMRQGYGEFIAWRSLFFYLERTGKPDVKDLLVQTLPKVYRVTFDQIARGGWASNDLFPAWAAYTLTGEDSFIEDNCNVVRVLLRRPKNIAWGGMDVMYFFNELHRRGALYDMQGI